MTLNEASLVQLKEDRVALQLGLESLQTGDIDIPDGPSRQRLENRRNEMIEQYKLMLENMERDIINLESES